MTRNQWLSALLLSLLLAVAGGVWQFGPYGLYAGAVLGILVLTFINIEKGGDDG